MMRAANDHDLEQELSFYTDDARFEIVGGFVKEGRQELRRLFERDALLNCRLTVTDFQVRGDTVTFQAKEQNDMIAHLGLDSIEWEECRATFREGRIRDMTATISPASNEGLNRQLNAFSQWIAENRRDESETLKVLQSDKATSAEVARLLELLHQWQQARKPVSPLTQGEFTAELNGLELWYKVSGAGPVCVMLNSAWGPSSDLAFRTLRPLEKMFTVVYLECRGTGRSQKAASTQEYTWDHLAFGQWGRLVTCCYRRIWEPGFTGGRCFCRIWR